MDLATVKASLMKGKFTSYEEFFAEMQLIWDNCKLYNMAGSDIYRICERMEKVARRETQKFRQAHGIPAPTTTAPAGQLRKRTASKAQA